MNLNIGTKYLSGNSFYPQTDELVKIVSADLIPAKELRNWEMISYRSLADETFAVYCRNGKLHYSPVDVFSATRYLSHADMVAAYAR